MPAGSALGTRLRNLWHALVEEVTGDVLLEARIDEGLAEALDAWADAHEVGRAEAVRIALCKLMDEEQARRQRIQEAHAVVDAFLETGILEPIPEDGSDAPGGRS